MNHTTATTVLLSLLSAGVLFADTFGSVTNRITVDFVSITGGAN